MCVSVFYSLQSAYCYFLIDRLIELSTKGVEIAVRPVIGGAARLPERYKDRDAMEIAYFDRDAQRCADMLELPFANPKPSPLVFLDGPGWRVAADQPRNDYLYRLFVGATQTGRGLAFLDHVARMLWDGSTPGWDEGTHLKDALARAGLDLDAVLDATPLDASRTILETNAQAMLAAGHWGVPLMVYEGEPFYGQDRFDHLIWRIEKKGDLPC